MRQRVYALQAGTRRVLELPPAGAEVLPGIPWGRFDCLFTPAFWASQVWAEPEPLSHRLGGCLREEVAACLLGGYGIPAEVGLAAFDRLKRSGLLIANAQHEAILGALSEPLPVAGRVVRYRFARQKARFLAQILTILDESEPDPLANDQAYRDWLARLPGIGLKTASWITRNMRDSDGVAIIDIHVFRAGRIAGVFSPDMTIERHYRELEKQFVSFANALGVRGSRLDAVIWDFMRCAGAVALSAFDALVADERSQTATRARSADAAHAR